jgi:predicted RNA methylase
MTITLDPGELETNALLKYTPHIRDKRVLEIGSGDGRLTWKYAHLASSVLGIDPDPDKIAAAKGSTPSNLEGRVRFMALGLEDLDNKSSQFDLAILSWSL